MICIVQFPVDEAETKRQRCQNEETKYCFFKIHVGIMKILHFAYKMISLSGFGASYKPDYEPYHREQRNYHHPDYFHNSTGRATQNLDYCVNIKDKNNKTKQSTTYSDFHIVSLH